MAVSTLFPCCWFLVGLGLLPPKTPLTVHLSFQGRKWDTLRQSTLSKFIVTPQLIVKMVYEDPEVRINLCKYNLSLFWILVAYINHFLINTVVLCELSFYALVLILSFPYIHIFSSVKVNMLLKGQNLVLSPSMPSISTLAIWSLSPKLNITDLMVILWGLTIPCGLSRILF
jgi:hypothetical protein